MLDHLLAQSITQWIALIFGIAYVILAAREKAICWLFGIVSCLCIAWDDFFNFRLYADGVLQLIYVVLGFVGLYKWKFASQDESQLDITEHTIRRHIIALSISVLLSFPIAYVLLTYTNASFGYTDVLTTILSLYATWLLINKILSNWVYWIFIDAVYIYLFYSTGGTVVALLYGIYLIVSVYGYAVWRRKRNIAH